MRYTLITVLLLVSSVKMLMGQNSFSFDKEVYDFDSLYHDEIATGVFLLRNISSDTLFIDVLSSSGNVVTIYSKEAILPGKCSMIGFNLLTQGRMGGFDKTLTVQAGKIRNTKEEKYGQNVLHIKGYVKEGLRPDGKIRFEKSTYDLGKISLKSPKNVHLQFENKGNASLLVKEVRFSGANAMYAVGYKYICSDDKIMVGADEYIKPGDKGTVLFKFATTDSKPGVYSSIVTFSGNFKTESIKVKFELVE